MLFWLGLILVIAGLVFSANDVTWFAGEESLAPLAIVVGVVLIVVQLLVFALAWSKIKRTQRDFFGRF
jgi:NADH:ubiquinone oxidoreductase subunit 2 (subunit N)